jgi:hypothetical protein
MLWRDVRLGVRQLRRSPVYSLVTIAALSIGVGANIALFSLVNGCHSALANGYFQVISIPKKCMNTWRVGLFFGFICGLRM